MLFSLGPGHYLPMLDALVVLLHPSLYVYLVASHEPGIARMARPLLPDALVEQGQVGDVEVTLLRSAEDSEGGAFVILARGDVMWLLGVPPDFLEEIVGSQPES